MLLSLFEVFDGFFPRTPGMEIVEAQIQEFLAAVSGQLLGAFVGIDDRAGRDVEQKVRFQAFFEADTVKPLRGSGHPRDTSGLAAADGTRRTLHGQSFS